MRLATLARRSLAATAATALLTSGAVVGLTGVAHADETVTVSPSGEVNAGTKTFSVTTSPAADEFRPEEYVTVTLTRQGTVVGQGPISGTPQDNSASCSIPDAGAGGVPTDSCGRTLTFTADLENVAPGTYTVTIDNPPANGIGASEVYTGTIGIAVPSSPTVSDSKLYTGTVLPPDGKLELSGTYLTKGTTVDFLLADKATVDTGLVFTPTVDGGAAGNGYVSSTVLRGTYTQGSFTAGPHYVRVTNPIAQSTTSAAAFFFQPRITSIAPSTLGQGATSVPVTIAGTGFDPTSSIFVKEAGTATGPAAGVGVGNVSVSGASDSVTTTISIGAATATGTRDLTVRGAKGDYVKVPGGLTITASPKPTSVSPNNRGQGFVGDVTVTGTGFNAGTTFDFGDGIGVVPSKSSSGGTTNVVTLTIAPGAALGARTIVARNTDFGTSALANGFTVNARPVITSLTPASALRGETKTVDLFGTGFVSGATLSGTPAGLTITNTQFISATQLRASFLVSPSLPADVSTFDIKVTNPDGGTSTLPQGFGVNSLSVLTTPVANAAPANITVQGAGLSSASTFAATLPGATDQGQLLGTFVSADTANNRVTFSLPLTKAAAGNYTVTATTTTGSTLTCTACLNVVPAFTPNALVVTPAVGGAGAMARTVTITSTNADPTKSGLSRGQRVSFGAGVTTRSTTYDAATDSLTAVIDIASNATAGARDVIVTNVGAPGTTGTKAGGFTVTAAPVVTALDPSSAGQGASVPFTVTGTGFQDGSTLTFSTSDVTATITGITATSITGTLNVASEAVTTSSRTLTVTNPDGGTGTTSDVTLTVTPKPVITGISPSQAKPGDTLTGVVFTGSGFVADSSGTGADATTTNPTILIGSVEVTNVMVVSDSQITADLKVAADASPGARLVFITNPDGGRSTFQSFTIATLPTAPQNVQVSPGQTTATVTWDAPSSDGGASILNYVVDDGDAATNNAQTVAADQRTATITGLTAGTTYTFSVAATNSVGTGPAGTATGTPFDVPTPPTSVTATPGDGQLTVSFSGANPKGSAISEYTVRLSNGAGSLYRAVASSPAVVTGLANGTTYTIAVAAKNAAGYGQYSTATATATPAPGSRLSAAKAPATVIAGQAVTYSGRLTRTDGTVVADQVVSVKLTPDVGASRTVNARTNANGVWTFRVVATYNTTVRASYAGGSAAQPATAPAFRFGVQTRVTRTAPPSGATSRASTTLAVTGATSPNKAGRTIALYRGSSIVARATVRSDGRYTLNSKLARGTYTLYVQIGTTSGNIAGRTAAFVVKRT